MANARVTSVDSCFSSLCCVTHKKRHVLMAVHGVDVLISGLVLDPRHDIQRIVRQTKRNMKDRATSLSATKSTTLRQRSASFHCGVVGWGQ